MLMGCMSVLMHVVMMELYVLPFACSIAQIAPSSRSVAIALSPRLEVMSPPEGSPLAKLFLVPRPPVSSTAIGRHYSRQEFVRDNLSAHGADPHGSREGSRLAIVGVMPHTPEPSTYLAVSRSGAGWGLQSGPMLRAGLPTC